MGMELSQEILAQSYRRAAKETLLLQESSELPRIVSFWSRVIPVLQRVYREVLPSDRKRRGEHEWVTQHPINVLLSDKISDLLRLEHITGNMVRFGSAYAWCEYQALHSGVYDYEPPEEK
jgi:hypothetical protein